MKYLWQYVCCKVFYVSPQTSTLAFCYVIACSVISGLYLLAKTTQPFLLGNSCYKQIKCIKPMSDHEIPLAICLLKGISCVSTHYNTVSLLCSSMSSNYWALYCGRSH